MPMSKTKTLPSQAGNVGQNGVDSFAQQLADLFSTVASSNAAQHFVNLGLENQALKDRNAALEATNITNMDTIAQRASDWKVKEDNLLQRLRAATSEVESLRADKIDSDKLAHRIADQDHRILAQMEMSKKKDADIVRLQNLLKQKEDDLNEKHSTFNALGVTLKTAQDNLSSCTARLEEAETSLATLHSFSVQLQPIRELRIQIQDAFANTFRHFLDFFVSHFGVDTHETFGTGDGVEQLRLPLPASNSVVAKQMRAVAALIVAGDALAVHVFRQTFVTPDHNVDTALSRLASKNAAQESYVRSVLLKMLPGEQSAKQEAGINDAVQNITKALKPWLSEPEAFALKLKPLCEEASGAWNLALKVKAKIYPDFGPRVLEDWRRLPLMFGDAKPKSSSANQNKPQAKTSKQSSTGKSSQSVPPKLNKSEVEEVVWPVFLARSLEDGEMEMVSCGYVLTKDQAYEAHEEISREGCYHKDARHIARQTHRRPSITQKKSPTLL